MALFLIKGTVTKSYYINDGGKREEVIRLVEAENQTEAIEKFEKHLEDRSVYNQVDVVNVSEMIV